MKPQPNQTPQDFWDDVYEDASPKTNGRPSATLERFAAGQTPGHALDLGCARGDDAVWLASQGWDVTAVDISPAALKIAQSNAAQHAVQDHIKFEAHDLTQTVPDGGFDLISAMFLQTPFSFPRAAVIARAASRLNDGGLLLVVTHGSAVPWSWAKHDHVFPTAQQERDTFGFKGPNWQDVFVGGVTRCAIGPSGETADVIDNVAAISRVRAAAAGPHS